MAPDFSYQLPNPKPLKTLASNVKYSNGSILIHQFVLDNSEPNQSGSANYINAVLLSMADTAVNAVNDEQYTALHLAVLKKNLLMVKKLLFCLPNIDVNKRCEKHEENAALHMAVKLDHLSIATEILNKGADINIMNGHGHTPLCFAACSGDLDMIKLLVSKGASVNLTGKCASPIHCAAKSGNLETVKILLSLGANLYAVDRKNVTILHFAAQSGHLATVKFLVNQGFNLNAEDKEGETPIIYAAISGHFTVVEFLAYKGPNLKVKNGWCRPLFVAVQYGHLDIIKFFLDRVANININVLLLHAATSCNLETLKFLIDIGADPNIKGGHNRDTPLLRAMKVSSNLAAVEFLVSSGADIRTEDKDGKSPLHSAVYGEKNLNMAGFLLEQGAALEARDKEGRTTLHDAVCENNLEYAEWLISKGADFHAKDKNGKNPLHMAVYRNRLQCSALLISKGANLRTKDKNGNTPLHDAVCGNNLECIELLINKGADLCAIDKSGRTPLHAAVIFGSVESSAMLIERGADINARDAWNGFTPLHLLLYRYKTSYHDLECPRKIELLLRENADVNMKDNRGETPVSLAMQSHYAQWFLRKVTEFENARNGYNPLVLLPDSYLW